MSDADYEGLPPNVKKAAKEADRKIAEIKQAETATAVAEPPANVVPPTPATSATEPAATPAAPAATETTKPILSEDDAKKLERMDAANPRADWKDRYAALLGKYNAEIPRLNEVIRQREMRIVDLESRLLQQPAPQTTVQDPNAAPQAPSRKYVDEKDVETFGPEFAELQERVAGRIRKDVESDLQQVRSRAQTAEQEVLQMKRNQFYVDLTRLVPDWAEINKDPEWLGWLGQTVQIQTAQGPRVLTRQQILDHYSGQLDSANVAQAFQSFMDGKTAAGGSTQVPLHGGNSIPSLASQVVPPRAKSAGSPQTKPRITSAYIKAFTDEVARGRYDSRPAERERIQKEIDLAIAENRVTR